MTPSCERELWLALNSAMHFTGPVAIRYPRGTGADSIIKDKNATIPLARAELLRTGNSKAALLNFGPLLASAKIVADKYDLTLVDMRFVKPLDTQLLTQLLQQHQYLFTLEDHAIAGGAGTAVSEFLAEKLVRICHLGIPDKLIPHGTREQQLSICGLDEAGIEQTIKQKLALWNTQH